MQRALDTAVQEITRATGMLDDRTVTVTVSTVRGEWGLLLPYVKLAAVATVTDPDGFAVTPTSTDLRAGIIDLPTRTTGGAWTVSVTGEPWPAALVTAA